MLRRCPLSDCKSRLLIHDQNCGGCRLMAQRARSASHDDCIGTGLGALLLAAAAPPAIAASSAARNQQERQQKQAEQGSRQGEMIELSAASLDSENCQAGQ